MTEKESYFDKRREYRHPSDDFLLKEVYQHPELTPEEFLHLLNMRARITTIRASYGPLTVEGAEEYFASLPLPPTITPEQSILFEERAKEWDEERRKYAEHPENIIGMDLLIAPRPYEILPPDEYFEHLKNTYVLLDRLPPPPFLPPNP